MEEAETGEVEGITGDVGAVGAAALLSMEGVGHGGWGRDAEDLELEGLPDMELECP